MGGSLPSECATTSGNCHRWRPACDGVRMDDERDHQRVRWGAQGCESVQAGAVSPQMLTIILTDDPSDSSKTSPVD